MNIYEFTRYVNQDVDDTFTDEEIARFFNKGIAQFNLIPPVTKFPSISMAINTTDNLNNDYTYKVNVERNTYNTTSAAFVDNVKSTSNPTGTFDEEIGAFQEYPLSNNFMLGVMLPFVVASVKGAESSVQEKQLAMQEFALNGRIFKSSLNIKTGYLVDGEGNAELTQYKLGENVYISDMTQSPMAGPWNKASVYKEYVVTKKKDGTTIGYVDSSVVDEDVETMTEEEKF